MGRCKVCFSEIKTEGINSFFRKDTICQKCYNGFDVLFKIEKIENIDVLFVYQYNEVTKKLIYQFKGCYDYELKDVFLIRHQRILRLLFKNYCIVPIPSSKKDDKKRGYNHVVEIFSILKLPFISCLKKTIDDKQSSKSKKARADICNHIQLMNEHLLRDKNILLVDDIYTTGNTLRTCINLIKRCKVKKIKAIIVCKNCRNSVNFLDRKHF